MFAIASCPPCILTMEERRTFSESRAFWGKVWMGLQRLFALVLFVPAHWLVGRIFRLVFPASLGVVLDFVEIVTSLFFSLIYVYLAWEVLAAFFPWLKRRASANIDRVREEAEEAGD
jgi:hypothetical protein